MTTTAVDSGLQDSGPDTRLDAGLDAGEVLAAVEAAVAARRVAEVAILHRAAAWADLHGDHEGVMVRHGATDAAGDRRGHPSFHRFGGEGTPVVGEFATAELGVSLRVHPLGARAWMADALDLRHRLVPLWNLTVRGSHARPEAAPVVEVWVLRKIAVKTRHLSAEAAALIAADLAPVVLSMPPGRLLERLDALVVLADAAADEDARQQGLDRRFAKINSSNTRGLKGLYAKLAAADAIVGDAQIHRLAQILLARDLDAGVLRSELDSIAVARSRALGLLIADPAAALALIQGTTTDHTAGHDDVVDDNGEDGEDEATSDDPCHDGDAACGEAEGGDSSQGHGGGDAAGGPEDAESSGSERNGSATGDDAGTPPRATPGTGIGAGGTGPGRPSRASTVLHLHLSQDALQMLATHHQHPDHQQNRPAAPGVGRLEGHGPLNLHEALELLRLTEVTIRPVLDPTDTRPVDSYAFTGTLREAVLTQIPADVYPYATCTTHHMDIDHTLAHQGRDHPDEPGSPGGADPGQTRIGNAGPMIRHHHRIKTHGPMSVRQPLPRHYVWRTAHGRYRLVDPTGTHDLDPQTGEGFFTNDPVQIALSTLLLHHHLGILDTDTEPHAA